ncbi:DUF2809 domain-containing protein [Niallia sp.]|uniref:ribosomal maturation YjgA family protein n=1 Tax=Niallia sp. TaxID=2837523 RepID=UPI0028967515|nr:DUF2809 domain-containing protein [Niallia sp.]
MKQLNEKFKGNERFHYIVTVLLMIVLGLSSRKYGDFIPALIANHAGDVIWAMMVYFGFRVLFIRKRVLFAGICSLLFSFGIEFSQLYQANWINELRHTTIGALILGKGFIPVDLVRYVSGISLAYFLDKLVLHRKPKQKG